MIRRILIAVANTEQGTWAADVGLGLAEQTGADAAMVHVVDLASAVTPLMAEAASGYSMAMNPGAVVPGAMDGAFPAPTAELRVDGERFLQQMIGRAAGKLACVDFLREGKPVDVILAVAQEWGADLIVMGTHGRGPLSQLIMGSTSETVLRQAGCPVVLVHQKPKGLTDAGGREASK